MAIKSNKIFIDSSVFFSFIDRADDNHSKSVKAFESLAHGNYHLFTSSTTVVDTYSALAHEVGFSVALEFLEVILQSEIEILFPQRSDFVSAFKVLKGSRERQLSLKEVVNAALMQKREITFILTSTYWHNLFGTQISNLSI